ncbi:MAG: hypothetical protein QOF46_893 [Paraburkholderia sp.]|nr:hypothetical protein [Paraburkholderia sp.]
MDPIQPREAVAAAIGVEEIAPAVARLTIANPPLNVLTQAVRREFGISFAGAQARRDLRCVIFLAAENARSPRAPTCVNFRCASTQRSRARTARTRIA